MIHILVDIDFSRNFRFICLRGHWFYSHLLIKLLILLVLVRNFLGLMLFVILLGSYMLRLLLFGMIMCVIIWVKLIMCFVLGVNFLNLDHFWLFNMNALRFWLAVFLLLEFWFIVVTACRSCWNKILLFWIILALPWLRQFLLLLFMV